MILIMALSITIIITITIVMKLPATHSFDLFKSFYF